MSWPITLGFSLFFHSLLIFLLNLNPLPTFVSARPSAYTVTLMPVSISVPETPLPAPPVPKQEEEKPVPKIKPVEKPKKDDIVEKVKKKEQDRVSLDRLQEALEEIRKKAALDEIQKRIAKQDVPREPITPTPPSPVPPSSSAPSVPSPVMTPSLSPALRESKLNEYYSLVWAKIKQAWTLPENLLKEKVDLEAIIVIIIERDGRVKRTWFEKKSGNPLYDQMAMRAIIKAEPLPPIPKELNQDTLEIGVRFFPE